MAACLAGFIGQSVAFGATTNSVWDLTAVSVFKVAKINVAKTNSVTAVFLSDGNCSLLLGTNEYAGTYTAKKSQVTLLLGNGGLGTLKSDAVTLIQDAINDSAITVTVKSLKFSKITLKNGVPVKATDTISGTLCGTTSKGKVKCKGFSLNTLWTNWTLSSGTNF